MPQGLVLREVPCVHDAHLGGHETMRDAVFRDETVKGAKVMTDSLRDNAHTSAAGEGGVLVHHVCIKPVTCKGRNAVSGLEAEILIVPCAEVHKVAVFQHDALRSTRGTGGVKQDIEALRLRADSFAGQIL